MERWDQVFILLPMHFYSILLRIGIRQGKGMNYGYPGFLSKLPHPLCAKVMNGKLMKRPDSAVPGSKCVKDGRYQSKNLLLIQSGVSKGHGECVWVR